MLLSCFNIKNMNNISMNIETIVMAVDWFEQQVFAIVIAMRIYNSTASVVKTNLMMAFIFFLCGAAIC